MGGKSPPSEHIVYILCYRENKVEHLFGLKEDLVRDCQNIINVLYLSMYIKKKKTRAKSQQNKSLFH